MFQVIFHVRYFYSCVKTTCFSSCGFYDLNLVGLRLTVPEVQLDCPFQAYLKTKLSLQHQTVMLFLPPLLQCILHRSKSQNSPHFFQYHFL